MVECTRGEIWNGILRQNARNISERRRFLTLSDFEVQLLGYLFGMNIATAVVGIILYALYVEKSAQKKPLSHSKSTNCKRDWRKAKGTKGEKLGTQGYYSMRESRVS